MQSNAGSIQKHRTEYHFENPLNIIHVTWTPIYSSLPDKHEKKSSRLGWALQTIEMPQ